MHCIKYKSNWPQGRHDLKEKVGKRARIRYRDRGGRWVISIWAEPAGVWADGWKTKCWFQGTFIEKMGRAKR
jgi:hypothetical protein